MTVGRKLLSASLLAALMCAGLHPATSNAQQSEEPKSSAPDAVDSSVPPVRLEPVVKEVQPWLINKETRLEHSLPEVQDVRINVTKKATVENLDLQPTVINNNQRELFDRVPGIVIAEQQNPSQLNLNYRGIGNPQESEYILSLQDGIPISLDWIGYPTLYYLPVPESLQSIEVVRGGSGLLYGPQPQPTINYASRSPVADRAASGTVQMVGGSDALFSNYDRVSGTMNGIGYLADYQHRRGRGERDNGAYRIDSGNLRLTYNLTPTKKIGFDFHGYSEDNGLPGFLTRAQFDRDADLAPTPLDHVWTDRYVGVGTYDWNFSERGQLIAKLYGGRTSLSNRSDTYNAAGQATSASLTQHRFYFEGLDARVVQKWDRANAFTGGISAYHAHSPWTVYTGNRDINAGKNSTDGTLNYRNQGDTTYLAAFAENVFRFPWFHVVPSVRFDHQEVQVDEQVVTAPHGAPYKGTVYKNIPLFGIGIGNDFGVNGHGNETYLNISQGYRPVRYRDVASNTSRLSPTRNDPDPTKYLTYELGVHGWPVAGLYYDVSVFNVITQNRIESQAISATETVNVNSGGAHSRGIEGELDYDVLKLWKPTSGDHVVVFANASYLSASITNSIAPETTPGTTIEDNVPAYSPRYVIKAGVTARRDGAYKVSLVEQSIGSQYWRDSNQPNGSTPARVPAHTVVDLSGDLTVMHHLRLLGGIANLLDRDYYSRVFFVNGGIEPANGRTFYAGAAYDF